MIKISSFLHSDTQSFSKSSKILCSKSNTKIETMNCSSLTSRLSNAFFVSMGLLSQILCQIGRHTCFLYFKTMNCSPLTSRFSNIFLASMGLLSQVLCQIGRHTCFLYFKTMNCSPLTSRFSNGFLTSRALLSQFCAI